MSISHQTSYSLDQSIVGNEFHHKKSPPSCELKISHVAKTEDKKNNGAHLSNAPMKEDMHSKNCYKFKLDNQEAYEEKPQDDLVEKHAPATNDKQIKYTCHHRLRHEDTNSKREFIFLQEFVPHGKCGEMVGVTISNKVYINPSYEITTTRIQEVKMVKVTSLNKEYI